MTKSKCSTFFKIQIKNVYYLKYELVLPRVSFFSSQDNDYGTVLAILLTCLAVDGIRLEAFYDDISQTGY